jgi:hypothetical protein
MLLSRSFHEATGNIYPRPSEERWVGRDSEINFHDDPDAMVRARRSEQLVFVKTHRLPDPEDDSPALYLVRDGRDAIVSYARFAIAEGSSGFGDREFEDAAETLIRQRDAEMGDWSMNVRSWTMRAAPTVIVRFEELIHEPLGVMRAAASRLGTELRSDAEAPPDFEQLHSESPVLFRRGQVGAWRSELPAALEQTFWRLHGGQMLVLGYRRDHPAHEVAR